MKPARLAVLAPIFCVAACSQQPQEQVQQQTSIPTEPSVNGQITNKDVTFTATTPDFAVISTATGKVSNSGPFVSVVLDHHTMRVNPKYQTPKKVLGYKVGLAFNRPDGKWEVARWSNAISQNVVLRQGDTRQIDDARFIIPIDGLSSLNGYWLVLAVELDTNGTVGYTYAHSNKGLF